MDTRRRRAIGQLIGKCCAYWERPEPEKKTLDLWLEELAPIPEKDMERIYIKFKRLGLWPKNYPKAILDLWRSIPKPIEPASLKDEERLPMPNFVKKFFRNFGRSPGLTDRSAPNPPPG